MADFQPTRDPDEELITQAFSSYRAAAPKNFPPEPAADVMAAAEDVRPRKRALTVSLAALAFTGLIAGGAAVAQTVASVSDGHVDRGGGNESTADGGGGGEDTSGPTKSKSPSGDATDEDSLTGLAITLPDFPAKVTDCPAGTYTFSKDGDSEPASGWALGSDDGIVTTLDDDGVANDLIVEIDCAELSGVIALERTDGEDEAVTKDFVDTASVPGKTIDIAAVDGKKVTVDTAVSTEGATQETFVFDGEGFTEAPDDTPSDDPTSPSETPSEQPSSSSPGSESTSDLVNGPARAAAPAPARSPHGCSGST